jgi:hypothetical protein
MVRLVNPCNAPQRSQTHADPPGQIPDIPRPCQPPTGALRQTQRGRDTARGRMQLTHTHGIARTHATGA